ncbi:MAG: hypothetical protein M3042_09715 [Actinomycetota bacterium]|nr:hypothetical protein [Actinomycetota bacterium]
MARGFRVDLSALQQAAVGVSGVIDEVDQQALHGIQTGPAVIGHDRLSGTLADFCGRWQRGVDHLATDGRAIADGLTRCAVAYKEADRRGVDRLGGTVERSTVPGSAGP